MSSPTVTPDAGILERALAAAHGAHDRDELLACLFKAFVEATRTDGVHIYLYDSARRLIYQSLGNGEDDTILARCWIAIGRSLARLGPQIESDFVILPLVAERRVFGIVVIECLAAFQPPIWLLTGLTHLFADALDRIELRAKLSNQEREQAQASIVQHALLESQSVAEVCEYAAQAAKHLCDAARSMVFLHDQNGWLQPVARRGSASAQHAAVPIEGSRIGEAVRTGQPLRCTISTEQWNLPADVQIPSAVELLAAPLQLNRRVIGVITLLGKQGGFTPADVRLAGRFADHVALAIDRLEQDQLQPALPLVRLTKRETEVLCRIAQGRSNGEIAATLGITDRTVSTHLNNILSKLQLSSRTQAALYALQHDLVAG